MLETFFGPIEVEFVIGLALSVILGFVIGAERETRHKAAGISTHILVISGAMLFSLLSGVVNPENPSYIAQGVLTGIGFLGAGLILRDGLNIHNLTTAASIWFAGAIGMAIGFGFYAIAIIAGLVSVFVPRIPSIGSGNTNRDS